MAETFTSLYNLLYSRISNKSSKTGTALKEAIVSALDLLSSVKTDFTEDETTFATVASQATYTPGSGGVPGDLLEIQRLYYKLGTQPIEIPKASMDEVRFWMDETATTYPRGRAWHDRKIYLGPPPSGVMTLYLDYAKDARRDALTGALITTSSTTETNDWFGPGVQALAQQALSLFYKNPLFMSQERAAFADVQLNAAVGSLLRERQLKVQPSGQAMAAWTGGEGNETVYPLGRHLTHQ